MIFTYHCITCGRLARYRDGKYVHLDRHYAATNQSESPTAHPVVVVSTQVLTKGNQVTGHRKYRRHSTVICTCLDFGRDHVAILEDYDVECGPVVDCAANCPGRIENANRRAATLA
jgi:hypothetical protein